MAERNAYCRSFLGLWGLAVAAAPLTISTDRIEAKDNASLPAVLVQRALQAEIAGDASRRNRLLGDARRVSPDFAPARWQAGFVRVDGAWRDVDDFEAQNAAAGTVTNYRELRDRVAATLPGQIALARWCRRERLVELERLHWQQVLQLNPAHKEARKRLAVREHRGLLLTQEQIEAYRDLEKQREAALDEWKPSTLR